MLASSRGAYLSKATDLVSGAELELCESSFKMSFLMESRKGRAAPVSIWLDGHCVSSD